MCVLSATGNSSDRVVLLFFTSYFVLHWEPTILVSHEFLTRGNPQLDDRSWKLADAPNLANGNLSILGGIIIIPDYIYQ